MNGFIRVASSLAVTLVIVARCGMAAEATCIGDCNADSRVAVAELIRAVRCLLEETASAEQCGNCVYSQWPLTVAGLVQATNNALSACARPSGPPATPSTPTPTATSPGDPPSTSTPTRTLTPTRTPTSDETATPTATWPSEIADVEGYCYENSACVEDPYMMWPRTHGECCEWTPRMPVATWCPADAVDPDTGVCSACIYPCSGLTQP